MSGHGAPSLNISKAQGLAVTVVAGLWHEQISEALIAGAIRVLDEAGAITTIVRVPAILSNFILTVLIRTFLFSSTA